METLENSNTHDRLWSIADACSALGISYSTLNRWRYHTEGMNFPQPACNINNRNVMFLKLDIIE